MHRVAKCLELPGPVMCAAAGLHADGAWAEAWRSVPAVWRAAPPGAPVLAGLVDAVHRNDVLGEIDADEYDRLGLPLPQVS